MELNGIATEIIIVTQVEGGKAGLHSGIPQAPVEKELYMKIPKGFEIDTKGGTKEHVLKLHKKVNV